MRYCAGEAALKSHRILRERLPFSKSDSLKS